MKIIEKTLILQGEINKFTVPNLLNRWEKYTSQKLEYIDLEKVISIDSAGVAFLDVIQLKNQDSFRKLLNIPINISQTIKTFSSLEITVEAIKRERSGFIENIGNSFFKYKEAIVDISYLTTEVIFWSFVGIFNRKGQRKDSVIQQSILIGMEAIGIIGSLSLIFGLIMALQSAALLRQFGTEVFLADMIAVLMVREMGPILTAILVAGRSGSAIASEIATMKVTEEIDALKIMAIDPIRYVVVPKFNAITLCMPLLVTLSMIIGISGGLLISIFYLDLSIVTFVTRVLEVLTFSNILIALLKGVVFAWAIVIIGTYFGFKVEGGAEGVGKATTASVVASIFAVIVLDAIFSLEYLGG
ncbi:MAG: ABC transporter permease [Candidatus Cloacimonetes bacterium]|nr:ABC transporter permease [Candidatus Cloacimonadota bacterium]